MALILKRNTIEPTDNAVGAVLLQAGSSASPVTTTVASDKFIEIRAKSTATSGDNRLAYFRYDLDGAGAGGESLRSFTDLGAACTTARGAHISLQAGATGYVSGLGVGVDGQLYLKNEALAGGTYAAMNAEIWSEGASTTAAGATNVAFLRFSNGGDSTGAATVDAKAVLFDLSGVSSGASSIWYDHQGTAPTNVEEWIKIKTPAGIRYLAVYNAVV